MELYVFITAWICAILAMTGFSALITQILKWEFREHILLAQLLNTLKAPIAKTQPSIILGWAVHFAVGLLFMFFYELLWLLTAFNRALMWSIVFGMAAGILGILGWMVIFRLHPHPPKLHFKVYYIQLFFAHIVFSMTAYLVYSLLHDLRD